MIQDAFLAGHAPYSSEDVAVSPRTSPKRISEEFHLPVDFWYIKSHDRQALNEHIIPYVARELHDKYLLRTFMEKHTWTEELVKSELTEMDRDEDSACLGKTTAAFWTNPTSTTVGLLCLTRLWFFLLLRYTYCRRFCEGRELSQHVLDVRDLCTHQDVYCSALTEDAIYRLTRLRNRYGASFYRGSHKDTRRRLGWTRFCGRIRTFCASVGLHTSSRNPEKNLWDLGRNLTPIIMHRKWSNVMSQLGKENILALNIRKDVTKLNERVASGACHNVQRMKDMDTVIEDVNLQIEGLRRNDETYKQLIESLQRGLDELRVGSSSSQAREEGYMTAEALLLCRWLLEHLPAAHPRSEGLGHHWKQFWQIHWKRSKRQSHPLWELAGDDRYNKVGRNLYGTLSNHLHKYGHQLGDKLHPDVQRVVDVIKAVHYDASGKIDLQAERMRWL
jgi:hypothetical protein